MQVTFNMDPVKVVLLYFVSLSLSVYVLYMIHNTTRSPADTFCTTFNNTGIHTHHIEVAMRYINIPLILGSVTYISFNIYLYVLVEDPSEGAAFYYTSSPWIEMSHVNFNISESVLLKMKSAMQKQEISIELLKVIEGFRREHDQHTDPIVEKEYAKSWMRILRYCRFVVIR